MHRDDPRFVFLSRSYESVSRQILDALNRREGLIILTGQSGAGKTVLCRTLLQNLAPPVHSSFIVDPHVTPAKLLQQILVDFGAISDQAPTNASPTDPSWYDLLPVLRGFLAAPVGAGPGAVVVIDDAYRLEAPVIEALGVLANLETDAGTPIQILLAGQPELDNLLGQKEGRALHDRVARRCSLEPLAPTEVRRYLEQWLASVERHTRFSWAALRTLAIVSRRIPGLVNVITEETLQIAFERKASSITSPTVLRAAMRLSLPVPIAVPLVVASTLVSAALMLTVGNARTGKAPATPVSDRVPISSPVLKPALPPPAPERLASRAPSTDTETAVTGTLPLGEAHLVLVASFKNVRNAERLTEKLVGLGFPAFDRSDSAAGWQGVFIGPYATVDEVRDVQQQITALGFRNSQIRIERH